MNSESSRLWFVLALLCACACACADEAVLTNCASIRALPRDVAARRLPVQVRGVVTFSYPQKDTAFVVQDGDKGIYVERGAFAQKNGLVPTGWSWPHVLLPGTLIELSGVTGAGDFSPVIYPQHVRVLGNSPLPASTLLPVSELLDGKWDCQRVRVRGVVQFAEQAAPDAEDAWCELVAHDGRVRVRINRLVQSSSLSRLVDADVEVEGVVFAYWNSRGELLGARIEVANADDIRVLDRGPEDPFSVPQISLSKLQPFSPEGVTLHRRRCEGTVTLAWPAQIFYLQDGERGVRVETRDKTLLAPGDRVEVSGFVEITDNFGKLREAVVRKIGTAPRPAPIPVNRRGVLGSVVEGRTVTDAKDVDGLFVTLDGRVEKLDLSDKEGPRLLMEAEGRLVGASFSPETPPSALLRFEPGSTVRVNGVVRVELASSWPAQEHPRAVNYRVLVPRPDDVMVIRTAPWWTPRRLWFLLGGIGAVLVFTLGWNWLLRRRVERRSAQLAEEMRARHEAAVEFDATLRERERLAADLHDTLEQSLTGLAFQLETSEALQSEAPTRSARHLGLARQLLARSRDEVRRSIWNLRSQSLEGRNLADALRDVAASQAEGRAVRIVVETDAPPFPLPDFIAGNLLLLVQEALTNALKHSAAKEIVVRVDFAADQISISVDDDGQGFDAEHPAGPKEGHFGLQGMRERIKRLGGTLRVESAPGRGTRIAAQVPARDLYEHAPREVLPNSGNC